MKSISKFKLPIIVIGALMLSLIWHACKKENQIYDEGNGNEIALRSHLQYPVKNPDNRKLLSELLPIKVKNDLGTLAFDCFDDYKQMIDKLEEIDNKWEREYPVNEDDYIVRNEPLEAFETQLRFASFRKKVENELEQALVNETWDFTIENHPNQTKIRDAYSQAVLNPELEVIIGGSIFKYMPDGVVLETPLAKRSVLKKVAYSTPIEQIEKLPDVLIYWPTSFTKKGVCGNGICEKWACEDEFNCEDCITSGKGNSADSSDTTSDCKPIEVRVTKDEPVGPCDPLSIDFEVTIQGGDTTSAYEILWNFGDGSSLQKQYGIGWNVPLPDKQHTFPSVGNYTVTITVTDINPLTLCGSTTITYSVTPALFLQCGTDNKTCDKTERHASSTKIGGSTNDLKMYYELWNNVSWGNYTIKAKTEFYKFRKKKWRQDNVGNDNSIYVRAWGNYYIDNCCNKQAFDEDKNRNNANHATIRYATWHEYGHRPNEIKSTHKIIWKDWTDWEEHLVLPSYPEDCY